MAEESASRNSGAEMLTNYHDAVAFLRHLKGRDWHRGTLMLDVEDSCRIDAILTAAPLSERGTLKEDELTLIDNALTEYCDIPCFAPEAPRCRCKSLIERLERQCERNST